MKRLALIMLLATLGGVAAAQNEAVVAKSFTTGKKIMLRWAPSSYNTWLLGQEKGYTVERFIFKAGAFGDTAQIFPDKTWDLAPLSMEEVGRLAEKDGDFAALEGILDRSSSQGLSRMEQINVQDSRFGMALMLADFSQKIAQAQGLALSDSLLPENSTLGYKISVKGCSYVAPAYIMVNPKELSGLPKIPYTIVADDKEVVLSWNVNLLESHYVGYYVERGESRSSFTRLNSNPFVQVSVEDGDKSNSLTYTDTLVAVGKTYYYRLVGLSPFGIEAAKSDTMMVEVEDKSVFPVKLQGGMPVNSMMKLTWQCPDSVSRKVVKWELYKSKDYTGKYQMVSSMAIPQLRELLDKAFSETSYYQLKGFSKKSLVAKSSILKVLLVDTLPPASPTGLAGEVSKKGLARFSWRVPEEGLRAYNIYRSFYEGEKPIPVGTVTDTSFVEQLQAGLTTKVLYYVEAVDVRFNKSPLSAPLHLFIPDSIPPVPAVIRRVEKASNGDLQVTFLSSPSSDVDRYELCTKADSVAVLAPLTAPLVKAFTLKKGKAPLPNNILIRTIDKSGNRSECEPYDLTPLADTPADQKLAEVKLRRDREKGVYTLTITEVLRGTRELKVYAAVDGGRPELVKVLPVAGADPVVYTVSDIKRAKSYRIMLVGPMNVKPVNVEVK